MAHQQPVASSHVPLPNNAMPSDSRYNAGSDIPTEFANIVNNSSYSFYKFKQAEEALESAKRDLRRSKSELAAFPAAQDRAQAKYEVAKNSYNKAAEENLKASVSLNNFMQTLSVLASRVQTTVEQTHEPTLSPNIEEYCRKITEDKVVEIKKEHSEMVKSFNRQISNLKHDISEKNNETVAIIDTVKAYQKKEKDTVETMAATVTDLNRSTQSLEISMKDIESNIARLTSQSSSTLSAEDRMTNINNKIGKLETRVIEDRNALERAEKAFDLIYKRLEIVECASPIKRLTDLETFAKDLEMRLHKLESQFSKVSESVAQQSYAAEEFRQYETFKADAQAQLISQLQAVDKHSDALSSLQLSAEKVAGLETHLENLRRQVQTISKSSLGFDGGPAANVPYNDRQAMESLQQRISTIESGFTKTAEQIRGFVMAVQHLNNKFDEVSTDDIVMKVNLSLRNATPKHVQGLNNQVQDLTRRMERFDVLEKRVGVVERIARPHQLDGSGV